MSARHRQGMQFLVVASAVFALAAACSNSEEAAPSRTVVPSGSTSGAAEPDAGDVDANVDPSCQGADGCFTCEATRSVDILNACTDGTCAPFDNAARLPLYVTGQPLPAVP